MWSNDAKQQNCVRNKRKRDAHTHRDSLNWAAKPSFLLSAIVYFDFFSWRRTKSNFSLDIFFLHQFTINRLIHLNFWFASHINRVTISNGWNRNETTEIFFMFFLAKHKTSQRLTHIFSFIQTISSLSRLVSSKLTGDFVWVHRYKLHLPRNFNSCSGLIINNCSFFSIFDFDGNWLFTAAGSTILFKCVFFFFFDTGLQDECDSYLANDEYCMWNEHERKLKWATMNCTENLVHTHQFYVNACVIFPTWKREIIRAMNWWVARFNRTISNVWIHRPVDFELHNLMSVFQKIKTIPWVRAIF